MEFILFVLGIWILVAIFFLRERVKSLEQRAQKQDRDLERLRDRLETSAEGPPRTEPEKRGTGEPDISVASALAELAARRPAGHAAMAPPPIKPVDTTEPPPTLRPVVSPVEPPSDAQTPPPPRPPRPPDSAFSAPSAPSARFDWESLLGVKGAAWAGGLAFAIAGVLFAKYSFENDLIPPAVRIAVILLAGVAALVGAEFSLRKGYAVTANAVCGGGIAILYAGLYAGHALHHLFPIPMTFGAMIVVTAAAALLAVRHDAAGIAVLGLIGGFATPLLISTGENRPIPLFTYILLLDLGLLWIANRKGWTILAVLSLAGTFLLELGWWSKYMSPDQTGIAFVVLVVFAVLYLALPVVAGGGEAQRTVLLRNGAVGGLLPFLFAFHLAGSREYAGEWPILFALVACLDAALGAVALGLVRSHLLIMGAGATAVTMGVWAAQGLTADNAAAASAAAFGVTALLHLPPIVARRLRRWAGQPREFLHAAALAAAAGLGLWALILSGRGFGEPPWTFLALTAALAAAVVLAGARDGLPLAVPFGAAAVAFVVQVWFFRSTAPATLLRNLVIPPLLTAGFGLAAVFRDRKGWSPGAARDGASDAAGIGVALANAVGVAGLYVCAVHRSLGADPLPLFLALSAALVLLAISAFRRAWSLLLPLGLLAAAGLVSFWLATRFRPADADVVLGFAAAFWLAFLLLPFLAPGALATAWNRRLAPWLASSLAGPLFFWPMYQAAVAQWGKETIGILPVGMGAVSVVGLALARRRFAGCGTGTLVDRQRLRAIALFAAVALGFVSLAIPLQLDRQWITIGWALEAAAVFWLFLRIPHPGLKYFGVLLHIVVASRLLVFPEVLTYADRGRPIFNWILYTYGIPALCALGGSAWLGTVEAARIDDAERRAVGTWWPGLAVLAVLVGGAVTFWTVVLGGLWLVPLALFTGIVAAVALFLAPRAGLAGLVGFLGILLVFWLINLEIADYFSTGPDIAWDWELRLDRDLTMSIAWGVYALVLLGAGLWRKRRSLRFVSLGFMLLTVAKVFLVDLSNLEGLHRVFAFLGLAVALILVSLLYQRFLFRKEKTE